MIQAVSGFWRSPDPLYNVPCSSCRCYASRVMWRGRGSCEPLVMQAKCALPPLWPSFDSSAKPEDPARLELRLGPEIAIEELGDVARGPESRRRRSQVHSRPNVALHRIRRCQRRPGLKDTGSVERPYQSYFRSGQNQSKFSQNSAKIVRIDQKF